MFLALASLVAAVVPMFTYLLIIWWMDRYDREPFWLVLLNFFWGATGAIFLAVIGSLVFQIPLNALIQAISDGNVEELVGLSGAIITAPLVEETTKGIFLLIMSFNRRFDGTVDGAVYGGAIGLGFGMTENFMYFLTYGTNPVAWVMIVVIRTLFSAVMHCLAQATFGACVGFAKFRPFIYKLIFIPGGLIAAMFLHFMWNLTVSFEDTTLLGFLFLILYFFAILGVFIIAVYYEGQTIKRELTEESQTGVIPGEHLHYLPFINRRFSRGWCPIGVNQKEYVKAATTLAIRRNQYKNTTGSSKEEYLREIEQLRYEIQMMFYNAQLQYQKMQQGYNY